MTAVVPPPPAAAPPPPPAPPGGSGGPAWYSSAPSSGPLDTATGRSPWPTRDEWFDLCGLALLITLALYGFQSAYGGSRYLVAGIVGMLLGLAVALWSARTRQPLIVVSAATVGVFFLFGGAVAVPDQAIAGFLPSPGAVLALIDGAISGWAKLLTTNPPVGTRDNLLVVPYLCGLIAAVVSLTIARRTRWGQFALIPPVAVLSLSILFGTNVPASLVLQGAGFAVVAIGWVSMHRRANRRIDVGVGRASRLSGVVAVLVLAGLAAVLFGGSIPGAGTRPRVVLRDQTEPPFDPRNHPSPLSSFRRYSGRGDDTQLRDTTLFTVKGLETGDRLRLATMDSYDGEVFKVGVGAGSSGWFQRVGEQVPVPEPLTGKERTATVTVEDYTDIWVPGVGYLDHITFAGSRADELRSGFRYNESTGIGASTMRLAKGDTYTMRYLAVPNEPGQGAADKSVRQPDVRPLPEAATLANEYVAALSKSSAFAQIHDGLVAQGINVHGATSDDRGGAGKGVSRPGHHLGRLLDMVGDRGMMLGDEEQYAPLVTLMARDLGVPARVVMGFVVPPGHSAKDAVPIKGGDVHAWVEVAIKGRGWVPVINIDPQSEKPERKQPKNQNSADPPPPPPPTIPPTEEDAVDANKIDPCLKAKGSGAGEAAGNPAAAPVGTKKVECPTDPGSPFVIPGWVYATGAATLIPVTVLALITAVIAGLKSRRRTRRRTSGPPSTRVAGGWHEVIDLAADMGSPIPVLATRNEGARLMGTDAAVGLAHHADVGIFGPTNLTDDWVAAYWDDVDHTRTAMTSDMSRMERWRVLVSLASLRSSFDRWRLDLRSRGARRRGGRGGTDVGSGAVTPPSTTGPQPVAPSAGADADAPTRAGTPGSGDAPTAPDGAWYEDGR